MTDRLPSTGSTRRRWYYVPQNCPASETGSPLHSSPSVTTRRSKRHQSSPQLGSLQGELSPQSPGRVDDEAVSGAAARRLSSCFSPPAFASPHKRRSSCGISGAAGPTTASDSAEPLGSAQDTSESDQVGLGGCFPSGREHAPHPFLMAFCPLQNGCGLQVLPPGWIPEEAKGGLLSNVAHFCSILEHYDEMAWERDSVLWWLAGFTPSRFSKMLKVGSAGRLI